VLTEARSILITGDLGNVLIGIFGTRLGAPKNQAFGGFWRVCGGAR
jgi:hypothetical protein